MFFDYFIKTVLNKQHECDPIFRDSYFRRFVINTRGKNVKTINFLKQPLTLSMKRPQRCLYNDDDYYLALDTYSKTYYICFNSLLMIDMDFGKDGEFQSREEYISFLENYCESHPELLLEVYQTRNGIHCFVLNKKHDFTQDESLQLMLNLKCDFYYIVYSSIRGWSVRVNRKYHDRDAHLYTYITRIGTGKVDNYLEKLVKLHLGFSELFKDRDVSLMK